MGFVVLFGAMAAKAQIAVGREFKLEQAVIASGGGTSVDGQNTLRVQGTIGQAITGKSDNSPYAVKSGFWVSEIFTATVGGRVVNAGGRGLYGAQVILKDETGILKITQTNPFGYYRFREVTGNKSYTITVRSKNYSFAQTMLIFFVNNDFDQYNFTALPR